MVRLHVKKGDEDLFLFETSVDAALSSVTREIAKIYNARLKIARMCAEIECLADHGVHLPPNMVGLLPEQLTELNLGDPSVSTHIPSGGSIQNPDQSLERNGHAPSQEMAAILERTITEAKNAVHKNLVQQEIPLTFATFKEQYMKLKGAVTIVYPMGLPAYDPLHLELTAIEASNVDAGHGGFRDIIEEELATLWWAGKELKGQDRKLGDYLGQNEKTKVVVKLAKKGSGAPGREAVFTEEQKKKMMMQAYQRQQEVEKLMQDDDDSYMNSQWADRDALKRCFQGIKSINFRPV